METVGQNALEVAPPTAECQVCGTVCKRHSIARRKILDIDLDGKRVIFVRVGVYHCPKCEKHFRLQTGLAEKWKHYGKRALDKSFVAVRDDKTTFTALPLRLSRDFHINPSKSTCHRWFHQRADQISLERDYEPQAVASFSGALAIDEVYDKEFCIFFATDPLNRRPVSFHLCRSGNSEELRKFLLHLKAIGVNPEVLIVDGSTLYKSVPQEIWPNVRIQLCIFHVIRNCQDHIQDAIKWVYRSLPRGSRWPHEVLPAPDWWLKTVQQGSSDRHLIRDNRYAFTTRSENLKPEQQKMLEDLCQRQPFLATVRRFHSDLMSLFDRNQTREQAWQRLSVMTSDPEYQEMPHLVLALRRLPRKKFGKMIIFLDYENLDATTNHVERTNRWFRKRQKTHYRNRKERTIRNMLKADLLGRIDQPVLFVKLQRRTERPMTEAA